MNYDAKIGPEHRDRAAAPELPDTVEEEAEDRRSRRRLWIIGAVVVVVLIGLWFLSHMNRPDDLNTAPEGQAPLVSVISPGRTTITGEISATGTLAARREMPVGSVGDGGQVQHVLVEPGDWVRAGQVLAVIDRSVQTQQQASLAAQIDVARADAVLAQANLDRALKLVDRGFISRADVDRLTATRNGANAQVAVARAQLAEMRARTNRLNIVAPAAGLVLQRNVEPGQVVTSGTGVLFSIAKGGEMELRADLSEDDLGRIAVGARAQVTPVGAQESFTGQVWQIAPVIDPQSRQGTVRIALAYAPQLRPGGFAGVSLSSGAVVAPLLPESAVLSDEKGSYVYVVGADNKVARRDVRTGGISDRGVSILSGLDGTERIVARAGAFLSAGETVKPRLVKS